MQHELASIWNYCAESHSFWVISILPFVLHLFIFWSVSLLFLHRDYNRFKEDKLQKTFVTKEEMIKCAKRVLFNQFCILLPLQIVTYPLAKSRYTRERLLSYYFPSWNITIIHLLICVVLQEITFYYSHRLLHWGPFYTRIHKIHHEFRAPIAMAAIYAHPIEFILSNLVSIEIGPVVCQSHLFVNMIWFTIATFGTISHHSGYQRFWQIGGLDPHFHDYHHYSFIWNFGTLGILDRLHGTINTKGFTDYVAMTKGDKWKI